MRKKNKGKSSVRKTFLCLLLAFCMFAGELLITASVEAKNQTYDQTYNTIQASVQSKTKIKLSWKKKLDGRLDIYRCEVRNYKKGAYKKIASVSGKKRAYVDKVKYKKQYAYKIVFYSAANPSAKKNTFYAGQYTGVERVKWADDNPAYDYAKGPDFIELQIKGELDDNNKVLGMKPTGYEIYRKSKDESYKKIATVKSNKDFVKYKDTTVQTGETYTYKARAFRKLNGKVLYSNFTEDLAITAANKTGEYTVKDVFMTDQANEFVVALTSAAGNAEMVIGEADCELSSKVQEDMDLKLTAYSTDNTNWVACDKTQPLKMQGGQTYYLRFQGENGKTVPDVTIGNNKAVVNMYNVKYDGRTYYMYADLAGKTVTVLLDDND